MTLITDHSLQSTQREAMLEEQAARLARRKEELNQEEQELQASRQQVSVVRVEWKRPCKSDSGEARAGHDSTLVPMENAHSLCASEHSRHAL